MAVGFNILESVANSGAKLIKGMLQNSGTRALSGGAIGGVYSGIKNDKNDPNQSFSSIAKGALAGAAIGGISKSLPSLLFRKSNGKNLLGLGKMAGKGGKAVGSFVMNRPLLSIGVAGAGYGVSQLNKGGPDSSPIFDTSMEIKMNGEPDEGEIMPGVAPTGNHQSGVSIRNRQLLNSSYGLTQGLHRGRHS